MKRLEGAMIGFGGLSPQAPPPNCAHENVEQQVCNNLK